MKPFEYARPRSLDAALDLLSSEWGKAEILAGGTDLITSLKQGITVPERLVSLRDIASLRGILASGEGIGIGAMTPLAEIRDNEEVQAEFPALATAIKGIGAAQMQNAGTIGGDLCQRPRCWYFRTNHGLFAKANGESLVPEGDNRFHAIFDNGGDAHFVCPSSLGPALIALGAVIQVAGPKDTYRAVPAEEFFQRPASENERETVLKPNEIVTTILIPNSGLKNATYEVRHRHGLDWPYVTASVAFQVDGDSVSDARVVLGHVAPTPWSVPEAAAKLNGQELSETAAQACGEAAVANATPLSKNGYKLQLAKTAVKRALLAAGGAKEA